MSPGEVLQEIAVRGYQNTYTYNPEKPPTANNAAGGARTISEDSYYRGCLSGLREKTKGAPIPLKSSQDPGKILTALGLQGHNHNPWAWGWQDLNPPPAPKPGPKALPAEQIAKEAGLVRRVSRKDLEEAVRLALPAPTAHSPPTPPSLPPSKRSSRGAAAAPVPPPPTSVQVGSETVLFQIKYGQNDPVLKTSDKKQKIPIPHDLKCPNCTFQAKNSDSFKTHRSQGCGPSKKIPCPACGELITYSNTTHRKKCRGPKKK